MKEIQENLMKMSLIYLNEGNMYIANISHNKMLKPLEIRINYKMSSLLWYFPS